MIYWDPKLETGITVIDEDHKTLFGLLNALLRIIDDGEKADDAALAIAALNDYATGHFKREEALMLLCGYSGQDRHERDHNAFRQGMKSLQHLFSINAGMVNLRGVSDFLLTWLQQHIAVSDRAYVPKMQENSALIAKASENLISCTSFDL